MNLNEELALAGELELTDSELEAVNGGWWEPNRFDYDDYYPSYYPSYYPAYYYPQFWGGGEGGYYGGGEGGYYGGGEGGWGGGEGGDREHHDLLRVRVR